jgi:hypothetical protein
MSWFHHPGELFRSDKVLTFWPNSSQSIDERINASTRFILYLSAVLYLIKRDPRILMLAAMVIAVLYVFERTGTTSVSGSSDYGCQLPTEDNATGNVLLSDYTKDPQRPPACYYPTVKDHVSKSLNNLFGQQIQWGPTRSRGLTPDMQQKNFERAFVSMPVTQIPGDQTAFAEWVYGKKFQPLCRDTQSMCDPNARGVQLEAFGGLDSGDHPRGSRIARGRL